VIVPPCRKSPIWQDSPESRGEREEKNVCSNVKKSVARLSPIRCGARSAQNGAFYLQNGARKQYQVFQTAWKSTFGSKIYRFRLNRREAFILEYYLQKPNGMNADCMARLRQAKFPRISEDNFRVLKKRLFAKIGIIRNPIESHLEGELLGLMRGHWKKPPPFSFTGLSCASTASKITLSASNCLNGWASWCCEGCRERARNY